MMNDQFIDCLACQGADRLGINTTAGGVDTDCWFLILDTFLSSSESLLESVVFSMKFI